MAVGLGKCSKIHHIVKLRQMLRRWRDQAKKSSSSSLDHSVPSDVPSGHVAVYVGSRCRRFVVRATYLNHPIIRNLLVKAEEEFGFVNQGPLIIPCDESVFEESIRFISRSDSRRFTCHVVGLRSKLDLWIESRPLLHGVTDKAVL